MPNTKDRGHNPPDGADLNLCLVRSGGAEGRSQHHSKGLSAENRRQEREAGAAAWMRRLTVDFGGDPLRPAKLAERIGNHPNTNCVLNPSGRCSDREFSPVRHEPVGTRLVPALIGNAGKCRKRPWAYGSGGPLQPIPPTRDSLVLLQIELKSYTLVLYTFQFPAFVWMMMVGRLSEFPWVIVRVDCPLCPHRRGQYRLARLVEKFGADIQLSELLDRIAFDCPRKSHPWEQPPNECDPKCKARFTDLEATSRPPPDLPPAMRKLTVILGGKS
jgi:hypothetical protein